MSDEFDALLSESGKKKKKSTTTKEPTVNARVPASTYNLARNLASEMGITISDAIKLITGSTMQRPDMLTRVSQLARVTNTPSLIGPTSADIKDLAMASLWKDIFEKTINKEDDEELGGLSLEKIIGITMLMQANMQNMLMLMNANQNKSNNDDKFQQMMQKNNQMMQMMMQTVLGKKEQEIQETKQQLQEQQQQTLETMNQMNQNFLDALKELQERYNTIVEDLNNKIEEIDKKLETGDKSETTIETIKQKLTEGLRTIEEFEKLADEIAQKRQLSKAEVQKLEDVNKVLDTRVKYELMKRALTLVDMIGKPMAEVLGRKAAEILLNASKNPVAKALE